MKYNKKNALLFSLIKAVQVEFFGFFVMIFFWAVYKAFGIFANILFGFTGLCCIICIMADYAYKQGNTAKERARLHGDSVTHNFGIFIGLVSMSPSVIMLVILLFSKLGVIGNFLPAYKILNASYFPLMKLFAPTAFISDMPWYSFALLGGFCLLYLLSSWVAFRLSFDAVDVKEKVVYKH